MTSKTNTPDRAAAPPVRYRARDTSGRQVEGSSVAVWGVSLVGDRRGDPRRVAGCIARE